MKANELRIGNLLRDKVSKTELKVIELTEENIITYVIDRSKFPLQKGWGLEPIQLTQEWLLKFGFDNWFVNEYCLSNGLFYMNMKFYKNGNIQLTTCGESKKYLKGEKMLIHYVHQLQNLYFALTGEELTIKE